MREEYYFTDGRVLVIGNHHSVAVSYTHLDVYKRQGTHMTWDSLPTQVDASKHSFIILANTFREQTHQMCIRDRLFCGNMA